jgi:hypothetical protein
MWDKITMLVYSWINKCNEGNAAHEILSNGSNILGWREGE